MRERRALRIVAIVYGIFLPISTALLVAAVVLLPSMLASATSRKEIAARAALGVGSEVLILSLVTLRFCLALGTYFHARTLQRGTAGRFRLFAVSVGGMVWTATEVCLGAVFLLAPASALREAFAQGAYEMANVAVALGGWLGAAYIVLGMVGGLALWITVLANIACWWLVPERTRTIVWTIVDTMLLAGFVAVTLLLPLRPPPDDPNALALPVLRLSVTVLFALRVLRRVMPPALDLIESLGVRPLVAARYMRSVRGGFITVIGLLAIGAVTVSSCALTTTLSVMGGFRDDLKRKILGNHAHIVVDKAHGTFEGYEPILARARHVEGVQGASPFVSGEVMISSASNLSGAVLRGIDPETIGAVTELPRNMRSGRIDYLVRPERLLHLPAEEIRDSLIPMETPLRRRRSGDSSDDDDGFSTKRGRGVLQEIDDEIDEQLLEDDGAHSKMPRADLHDAGRAPSPSTTDDGAPRVPAPPSLHADGGTGSGATQAQGPGGPAPGDDGNNLDPFLVPRSISPAREVLPGIIVGQELARTLRLFLGDEVNVVSPLGALGPAGPMPKSRPFRVAGIFYSGMYEYDMKYAYVTLDTAQEFLGTGDAITGVEIKVDDVDRAPLIARAVHRAIARPQLRVRDWQELNKNLFGALALEKLAMFIALGIAILVASFSVTGILTLMVEEKGREIAILKAMGASDAIVVSTFMIGGLLIGVIGSGIGVGLGYIVGFAAEHFGIKMNPEVYYIDKLPVHMELTEFVLVGLSAIVVCLIVTIYPALLASRLRPVDALRYQ